MKHLSLALPFLLLACRDAATDGTETAEVVAPQETQDATQQTTPDTLIAFEHYELENGLDVILHQDRSDPVVAVNLAVHVGSGREDIGRTGFAHLFEHLLFLDSENLGYGGLDEMNTRIGGEGTNGFTTTDMTQYFQAVPADALEKVVWAEADKIGYFIETVSDDVLANEKQVVKNEKRQSVDNRPYGHNFSVIAAALYPEGHPYHHSVIGSLADLDAATLDDVKSFYSRYYGPQNVTFTISGDFEIDEAKALVDKYFGDLPRGPDIPEPQAEASSLSSDLDLLHEDNFATVPQLTLVWPTVADGHPDAPALQILAQYLTTGKKAPFNEVLVDEMKVAPSVSAFPYAKDLAGEFYIAANTNQGEDIDGLLPAIDAAFARFEETGIPQADLDRIKTGLETDLYGEIQSALGKSIALGEANTLKGDPGAFEAGVERLKSVTPEDVMRVYETYIQGKPRLSTSFVPKGETELGLAGAQTADVTEEVIVEGEGAAVDFDPAARVIANPTPSSFDRTVEPAFGASYTLPSPDVTVESFGNGLEVYLLESDEVPLVRFSLRMDAGKMRNTLDAPAIASLTADMMSKGTANRTTAELEDALNDLGSSVSVSAGDTAVFVSGTTLARNFAPTMDLVKEMVFEPRFDAEEFDTLVRQNAEAITRSEGEPNRIAARELAKLINPETSIFHHAGLTGYGTREALEAVTLEDIREFHARYYTLDGAKLRIAGDVDMEAVATAWNNNALPHSGVVHPMPQLRTNPVEEPTIYFYDVPGAKQSVIRMSRPALDARHPDFGLAEAINFQLGGIYTSDLMTELRVNKGYTYGIRSSFSGNELGGDFQVGTSVRSNVTKESLELIRQLLADYGPKFTDEELESLRDARIRGQALGFETLGDKSSLLGDMSAYGYPASRRADVAEQVRKMDMATFRRIASEHIDPDRMITLIVGDAETQLENVKSLGLPVVELN